MQFSNVYIHVFACGHRTRELALRPAVWLCAPSPAPARAPFAGASVFWVMETFGTEGRVVRTGLPTLLPQARPDYRRRLDIVAYGVLRLRRVSCCDAIVVSPLRAYGRL